MRKNTKVGLFLLLSLFLIGIMPGVAASPVSKANTVYACDNDVGATKVVNSDHQAICHASEYVAEVQVTRIQIILFSSTVAEALEATDNRCVNTIRSCTRAFIFSYNGPERYDKIYIKNCAIRQCPGLREPQPPATKPGKR